MSHVTGWTAHITEQLEHNALIRPLGAYNGPGPAPAANKLGLVGPDHVRSQMVRGTVTETSPSILPAGSAAAWSCWSRRSGDHLPAIPPPATTPGTDRQVRTWSFLLNITQITPSRAPFNGWGRSALRWPARCLACQPPAVWRGVPGGSAGRSL
ncbi:hypothetical protein GTY83_09250 [Streptomyces sp. SID4928]|nr:hypothetical protein [Streptomyces sp. SID4928]